MNVGSIITYDTCVSNQFNCSLQMLHVIFLFFFLISFTPCILTQFNLQWCDSSVYRLLSTVSNIVFLLFSIICFPDAVSSMCNATIKVAKYFNWNWFSIRFICCCCCCCWCSLFCLKEANKNANIRRLKNFCRIE